MFVVIRYHWPNGVVPYTIDAAFTSTERAAIASGIEHIHENSCIRSFLDALASLESIIWHD